jgi:preprotein translocase subunit SecA
MSQVCNEHERLRIDAVPKLHTGLDTFTHAAVGSVRRWLHRPGKLHARAQAIHDAAEELRCLDENQIRKRLETLRESWRRRAKKPSTTLLDDSLATLVEAAHRRLGLRPFPVQVMGALGLHHGLLVEMATGEGKTLTAALAATLAGWTGKPCHVITVNDYLAQRDADWLRDFYACCSLDVGCVTGLMNPAERRQNYDRAVTYATSKEILADFLRDRIKLGSVQHPERHLLQAFANSAKNSAEEVVMRGLGTAIVDEADSVLIDEAVTPLIISKPTDNLPLHDATETALAIAESLEKSDHYTAEDKYREIRLRDKGQQEIEKLSARFSGMWRGRSRREEMVRQALRAREFYHRDQQYLIQDGKVVIVDEFTGRSMPNRSWSHGLHQAVEAKEGVEITDPTETLARLSFQRFFRMFPRLSGMTGTGAEAGAEFWHIYRLPVLKVPTNRPCIRKELPDSIFNCWNDKMEAVVAEVLDVHADGRPILVGTRSVDISEELARRLEREGLAVNVINAVRHAEEAEIVARAGLENQITIATNMAGRGTDIKLGPGIAERGGLHVIATERHESTRIDRQLFGRCARQGDPGTSHAFISLEDEILRRFIAKPVMQLARNQPSLSRQFGRNLCRRAQKTAERIAFRQRKGVLKNDTWFIEALSFAGSELSF